MTALLLAIGLAICLFYRSAYPASSLIYWPAMVVFGIVALTIVSSPQLRELASRTFFRLNSSNRRVVTAVGVFAVSAAYFIYNAVFHNRDLTPRLHDENSYLIQARMMARGRLWMPPFPDNLGDFFESFHLLVKPVYASIYFPGSSLLYVPGMWLGTPDWLTTILITAAAAAMLYLVTAELLGGGYGVLAAVMLVMTPRVRWSSTVILSHQPALLAGLLIVWTWLRWRQSKHLGWAVALGAVLGWSAIVRPFDMLAVVIPAGIAFLFDLRGIAPRRIATIFACIALTSAPFLGLQLALNRATTGKWLMTPYRFYIDQFQPGSTIGFPQLRTDEHPKTSLQQKIDLYEDWARPQLAMHRLDNLWQVMTYERLSWMTPGTLPSVLLLILLPAGFAAAAFDRRRLVVAVIPPLFWGLYLINPYFVQHYPIVIAPEVILVAMFAIDAVARLLAGAKGQGQARVIPALAALVVTLAAVPEFGGEPDNMPSLGGINQNLPLIIPEPQRAVVMFHYGPGAPYHAEPVYNYDVAWPLDARIIRVQDLGPARNAELLDYFAANDPGREFYFLDRTTHEMHRVGTLDDARHELLATPKPATHP